MRVNLSLANLNQASLNNQILIKQPQDNTSLLALIRALRRVLTKTSRNIGKRRVVVARCAMVMMVLQRRNMARRLRRLISLRLQM